MKALVLDGSKKDDNTLNTTRKFVEEELKEAGWESTSLTLRDIDIAPCLGCFGCWIKTPGVCVIDDSMRDISKTAFQSDLIIFITRITFGGCSSEIKKILDRWISLVLPFFTKVKGEIHHMRRYTKHPKLAFMGALPYPDNESERIFEQLTERIAINSRAPAFACGSLLYNDEEEIIRQKVITCLVNVKALN